MQKFKNQLGSVYQKQLVKCWILGHVKTDWFFVNSKLTKASASIFLYINNCGTNLIIQKDFDIPSIYTCTDIISICICFPNFEEI